jgi:hypothetical protein
VTGGRKDKDAWNSLFFLLLEIPGTIRKKKVKKKI